MVGLRARRGLSAGWVSSSPRLGSELAEDLLLAGLRARQFRLDFELAEDLPLNGPPLCRTHYEAKFEFSSRPAGPPLSEPKQRY